MNIAPRYRAHHPDRTRHFARTIPRTAPGGRCSFASSRTGCARATASGKSASIGTGRALGIVSRLCAGTCSEEGPTVQGILAKAASRGFSVTLRTV